MARPDEAPEVAVAGEPAEAAEVSSSSSCSSCSLLNSCRDSRGSSNSSKALALAVNLLYVGSRAAALQPA